MTDTTARPNPPSSLQDDTPRDGATPLLWLLLVLTVLAFGWWYLASRDTWTPATGYDDITVIEGSASDAAAEAERGAAARPARPTATQRPARSTASRAPATRSAALLAYDQPRYPAAAQRQGVEGSVTLRIDVDPNGVPTDIGYASRSGNIALDRAALVAARDWRFRPATRDGRAVASTVNVPVDFRL